MGRPESGGDKSIRSHKKDAKSDRKRSNRKSKHKKRKREISSSESEADYKLDAQSAPVAADYVRCILRKFPTMRSDLRELIWQIDAGESPQLNHVEDPDLLRGLRGLFGALNLKRSKDTYSLKRGQDKILRRIGVVFNEVIPDRSNERLRLPGDPTPQESKPYAKSRTLTPVQDVHSVPHVLEKPYSSPSVVCEDELVEDTPLARKFKFPAAAPQELLQAAAEAAAAMRAEGLLGDIVSGLSAETFGPVPPADVLKDLDAASGDVRAAEVIRVNMLVARAPHHGPDAYEVLNVPETATASEVRKKFWRVSLLVHPDKCRHECAANAFDAVKKAAEALLDAGTRHGIDERKRKEANTQLDQQVAAELEKERQWRVAQGTATAEDLRGPVDAQEVRDEWMTSLPELKEPKPAYMTQASVTSFSHQGASAAELDARWTALPGQKASDIRLLAGGVAAAAPTVQPMTVKDSIAAKNAHLMALVQQQKREDEQEQEKPRTLLEKHQEAQKEEQARRKSQRKEAGRISTVGVGASETKQPDWARTSAWRPFDREKDMQAPGRSSGPGAAVEQSLTTRFRPASS